MLTILLKYATIYLHIPMLTNLSKIYKYNIRLYSAQTIHLGTSLYDVLFLENTSLYDLAIVEAWLI